jgi:2-furoyl-CoA dehydrogenase large subunit
VTTPPVHSPQGHDGPEGRQEFNLIGKRVPSKEGPRFVRGKGQYVDDLRIPGMLHAAIGRSPHAHARILAARTEGAAGLPGVEHVFAAPDLVNATHPFSAGRYASGVGVTVPEYAMANGKVRYVGEPVSAVAATDVRTAEDALRLVEVDYEPLEAVTSIDAGLRDGAPLLFEELGSNAVWKGKLEYGDVEEAFRQADSVVETRVAIHRYSSTPLETFACLASYDQAGPSLTIWVNCQAPDVVADALREALGISDVRLIVPDIGGGFGQKIHLIRKYAVITALLSKQTGRPVKWVESRTEHMMAGGHACAQRFDIQAAVKRDGVLLGLRVHEMDDVGGSLSTATIHFTNKLNSLTNTYRPLGISLEGTSVVTNACPVVPNRGIGKPAMCLVWERTMDRIAEELGLDRVEVRLRNVIHKDEFPFETLNGNVYDSGDYEDLLHAALERIDLDNLKREQDEARSKGRYIGIGIALGVEPGGRNLARDLALLPSMKEPLGSGGTSGATIRVQLGGSVTITVGTPSGGQAHETTVAQVVGDVLMISPDQVRVLSTFDSALSPWGGGSTNSGNNFHLYDIGATHGAALRIREKLTALAASLLNATPSELTQVEGGAFVVTDQPERRVTFAELAKVAYGNTARVPEGMDPGLHQTYMYRFPHAQPFLVPDEQHRVRAQFTFSAAVHMAVVDVDPGTGRVKVLRYLVVGDNGNVINPDVVNGQVIGSAAHGISVALGEGFAYGEDGNLETATLLEYGKASTMDTPHIEVEHRPQPSPFTALGQKAAGEGAAITSPAAIASAVEDALRPFGARVEQLPLDLEAVWRLARGE